MPLDVKMLSRSSLSVLENNNAATLYNNSLYLFLFMCNLCTTLLIFINVNISVQIPLIRLYNKLRVFHPQSPRDRYCGARESRNAY